MLLKKLDKNWIKPIFTCWGGHDTVRSHELQLSSKNYDSGPIITMLAPVDKMEIVDKKAKWIEWTVWIVYSFL